MQLFWIMLTILFIGLKLTNQIDWSWWLVLLPMYGGIAFMAALAVAYAALSFMTKWPFKSKS
jgi:hypothetical protein